MLAASTFWPGGEVFVGPGLLVVTGVDPVVGAESDREEE
jgi:hypothetical protein